MLLRKNPRTVISIGMMALALASLAKWTLRHTAMNEGLADGITGFAYGVSIATLLLGIWMVGRERGRK